MIADPTLQFGKWTSRLKQTLNYALKHGGQLVSFEDCKNECLPPPHPQFILPSSDKVGIAEAKKAGLRLRWVGDQAYMHKGPFYCWLDISAPASERTVSEWESSKGIRLPEDFRHVLLNFAEELHFACFIETQPEGPWHAATLTWSLNELEVSTAASLEEVLFFEEAGQPKSEEVARVFGSGDNKLFFQNLGNGDALLMNIGSDAKSPVICVDHEQYELPVMVASNFTEFLERITLVGCFADDHSSFKEICKSDGLDTSCPKALQIRSQLGLDS